MRHLLSLFALTGALLAQDSRPSACRALAEKYLADTGVVGLAAAIVRDGTLELTIEAGLADREGKKKVEPTTLFRLGSVSKPVTAVGAMKLVEGGKLTLDQTVAELVPEWPKEHPKVTLRQLLSHTGGVRHYRPFGGDPTGGVFKHYTTAEAVALFAKDPLVFPPGTKESYSTHAFTLVARAVETASGTDFVACMRKTVFGKELDCEVLSDVKPERTRLYTLNGKEAPRLEERHEDNSWKYGGGGMEASARGLAQWADSVRAGKLLDARSLESMWTGAVLDDGKKLKYGLGWRLDGAVVSHGGAQQGCKTALIVDRARKLAVVVLTNTGGNHAPDGLARGLAELWR
jgi:serine beta-lactamase-like protein LACTB